MSNTVTGLVYRLIKGSPLSTKEVDGNFSALATFANGLAAIIGVSLNADGTLTAGALNAPNQIANQPLIADTLAAAETALSGVLTGSNYVITSPNVPGYTIGSKLTFIASAANLGPTTAQWIIPATTTPAAAQITLPEVQIVKGVNQPLIANDILALSIVELIFDGTNFQLVNMFPIPATAADVIAGINNQRPVTPSVLSSIPGLLKAYVTFSVNPSTFAITILQQNNVASVTRNGAGDYTITFTNPFTDPNFAWNANTRQLAANQPTTACESNLDPALPASKRIIITENGQFLGFDAPKVFFTAVGV